MWDRNKSDDVIAPDQFGAKHRGALRPTDATPTGARLVCVVEDSEVVTLQRGRELVLRLVEFPGLQLWCNRAMVVDLCAMLGNVRAEWPLRFVPLEVVEVPNPQTGGRVRKWYVAQALEWDAAAGLRVRHFHDL